MHLQHLYVLTIITNEQICHFPLSQNQNSLLEKCVYIGNLKLPVYHSLFMLGVLIQIDCYLLKA